ncbi:MAG: helix-turn-helix transcriptional regulator [Gammaproteobacteria bacterium]|nr:helix-turn-helix transcriptional regulator [Gammaproteobacteria bacterium]
MLDKPDSTPRYMTVRQLAQYLQINEKKVYALAADGVLPGTKATGKWLFPRELVDRWLLETSHGGALTDRLVVSGGEDLLLQRAVLDCTNTLRAYALICYVPTDTRLGLSLLNRGRVDASVVHWGPADESGKRHPALLRHYAGASTWVLVHLFRRSHGLLLNPELPAADSVAEVFARGYRWAMRGEGSGAQRFLHETVAYSRADIDSLHCVATAASEREAAMLLRTGAADVAPGSGAVASEFGLNFVPSGWEDIDLAVSRGNYFRDLLQRLLQTLKDSQTASRAHTLGGYDLGRVGELLWQNR